MPKKNQYCPILQNEATIPIFYEKIFLVKKVEKMKRNNIEVVELTNN